MRLRSLLRNALALPFFLSGLLVVISLFNAHALFSDQVYAGAVFKAAESWGPQPPPLVCDPEPVAIKSIWPAVVELDPETLRVKGGESFWEITKEDANPYGNYAWGLSGQSAASLHFLHTICNFNNGDCVGSAYPWASIFNLEVPSGSISRVDGTDASAFGLAQHGGEFYFAAGSTVGRKGGDSLTLPESIGGLDHVSGDTPYLLAITSQLGSQKVWRIDLDADGDPTGSAEQLEIQAGPGSPLEPFTYTGLAHAVMPWGSDPGKEVLFVSKDDGSMEPVDRIAIIDFGSGNVLYSIGAAESGLLLESPITWENGVSSYYLNWANPQGLAYIDGRLFLVSRFYWNKGPKCEPAIQIEKSAPSEARFGETLTYEFRVTNVGQVPLYDIMVLDDVLGDLTGSFTAANEENPHLDLGASVTFDGQHTIPWDAPDPLDNTATVSGRFQDSRVQDSASHSLDLLPPLVVEKSGPESAAPEDTVEYVIEVENGSAAPLTEGVVNDERVAFEAVLGEVLFQDDFNSEALAGDWEAAGIESTWSFAPVGPGNYARRHTTGDPPTLPEAQVVSIGDGWADYSLSLDLRADTGNRFPGGVRVRVDGDTGAGYSVWLYPVDGRIRLWRSSNWQLAAGDRVELASAEAEIGPGWHHLRVDLVGESIAVIWNGERIIEHENDDYLTGTVALEPGRSEMSPGVPFDYDNISVQTLPAMTQPGQVNTYRLNHTLPQSAEGAYENTASAVGYAGELPIIAEDDHQLDVALAAGIVVEKFVSLDEGGSWQDADEAPGPEALAGADLSFKLRVVNTGTATLTNITLSDSDYDVSACPLTDPLEAGASFECVIGPLMAGASQHKNTATATGHFGAQTLQATDDAHYFGALPLIDVEKSVSPDGGATWYDADDSPGPSAWLGDQVIFKFTIKNVGNVPLSAIELSDDGLNTSGCSIPDSLPPANSAECEIGPFAVELGQQVNSAAAAGQYNGTVAEDFDSTHYYGRRPYFDPPIQSGSDDTHVYQRYGRWYNNLTGDYVLITSGQWAGLRFSDLEIPQGAMITSAYIELLVWRNYDDAAMYIYAESTDSASDFSADLVPNRPRTDAYVRWTESGLGGGWAQSPDLSALIQQVVDRQGWAPGSALALHLQGLARDRLVFDQWEADQGASAARLQVAYDVPTPNTAPTVFAGEDQELSMPADGSALTVQLSGEVHDDGLPDPPGNVSVSWSQSAGPDGLTFADANQPLTTARIPLPGSYALRLTANDGEAEATDEVVLRAYAPNQPPAATHDRFHAEEATLLSVDPPGVLGNDSDPEGDALQATLTSSASHGSVTLSADGSFVYMPGNGFLGEDLFTYVASDGNAQSEPAAVTIVVESANAAPIAVEDQYVVDEDQILSVDAAGGLLSNDRDEDGDSLQAILEAGPESGSLSLEGDGSFIYTPAQDANGEFSFSYRAEDGRASSPAAVVRIDVRAVNDEPVAEGDEYSMLWGESLEVLAPGVLANDVDVDGDPLSASLGDPPSSQGGFDLWPDGSFQFAPPAEFSGVVEFTYRADDGLSESDLTTVRIEVVAGNRDPEAEPDSASTTEDIAIEIDVLANDSDPDGDALRVASATAPAHGSISLPGDGLIGYVPDENYFGVDQFRYTVVDRQGGSAEAQVLVEVVAVNDPPQAVDDLATTPQDTAISIPVLDNDTDVERGTLLIISVSNPAHGAAEVEAGERVIYTPAIGFSGADEFTYTVQDSQGATAEALVAVTVEAACEESLMVEHLSNQTADYVVDLTGREYLTARLLRQGDQNVSPAEIGDPVYTGNSYSGRYVFEFMDGETLIDEGGRFMTTTAGSGWRVPISGAEGCHSAVVYVTVMHNRSTTSRFDIQAGDLQTELTDSGYGRHSYAIRLTFSQDLEIIMAPQVSSANAYHQLGAVVLEP